MSRIPIDVQRRFEQRWACRFNRSPAPKQAGQTVVQLADGADGKHLPARNTLSRSLRLTHGNQTGGPSQRAAPRDLVTE